MNLKEAFRFQNKLRAVMEEASYILQDEENLTRTETTHLRKKVMEGAENETIVSAPPSEFAENINDVIRLIMFLLSEREKLAKAIRAAKAALAVDLDSEVSLNRARQDMARVFSQMCGVRNSEQLIPNGGVGYRFNQEGNQVNYLCDAKRVVTINFDRKAARNHLSELNRRSDAVSAELDVCLVTTPVNYQPPFDVNATLREIIADFSENSGKA